MIWGETVKKIVFRPRPWPPVAVAARGRSWPWPPVAARGRPWPPVAVAARGRPWPLVAVAARGRPWPWPPVAARGRSWPLPPVDARGSGRPWLPLAARGRGQIYYFWGKRFKKVFSAWIKYHSNLGEWGPGGRFFNRFQTLSNLRSVEPVLSIRVILLQRFLATTHVFGPFSIGFPWSVLQGFSITFAKQIIFSRNRIPNK